MEKKTLEDFKQEASNKTGITWYRDIDDAVSHLSNAYELYIQYCREDQHKIAVDMALEWAAENAKSYMTGLRFDIHSKIDKQSILKGKTDKSLQYEK